MFDAPQDVDLGHLIFIGGSPRSGTTLVQRILNAHPAIYGGPEIDVLPLLANSYDAVQSSIRRGRISPWLDAEQGRLLFRRHIHDLFAFKRASTGASYISENSPSNILVFKELAEICPEARFVVVVRDPRAVACSMLEVGRKHRERTGRKARGFVRSLAAACDYMEKCLRAGQVAVEANPGVLVIHYEDVIQRFDEAVAPLFQALKVPAISQEDLTRSNFEAAPDKRSWTDWYSAEQLQGGIQSQSLDRWRSKLTAKQVGYVEARMAGCRLVSERYLGRSASRKSGRWCRFQYRLEEQLQVSMDLSRAAVRRFCRS